MSRPNAQEEPDIAGSDVIRHALAAAKYRADKAIEGALRDSATSWQVKGRGARVSYCGMSRQ
jgi:hypothetical protein